MSKIFKGKFGKSLLALSLGGALLASPVLLSGCEGKQGPAGVNGPVWHFGEENPTRFNQSNDVGVNGDFYLDQDDMYLYTKINGEWKPMGSLIGTGVQDVYCEYVVDADGNTILTTTYVLTNGTQKEFETCVLPTVYVGSVMTLERAIKLAPVNATIELKNDVIFTEPITLNKKITLKLNGHTVNGENSETGIGDWVIATNADYLTIVN